MAANFFNLILETFLVEIHIFYCQYAKVRNDAYEKVHFNLLQSFFKIKITAHSQLFKKRVNKLCSPCFCAIVISRKNVSNMLCLIMKVLTEKTLFIIHFLFCQQPYSMLTITQDLIKLRMYSISTPSLYEVSTLEIKQVASVEERIRPGKIQIFFSKYLQN